MSGRSFGVICTAIWLILTGLLIVSNLQIQAAPVVLAFLAIVAGVLLLLGK